jgi:hypothetical protein
MSSGGRETKSARSPQGSVLRLSTAILRVPWTGALDAFASEVERAKPKQTLRQFGEVADGLENERWQAWQTWQTWGARAREQITQMFRKRREK